MRLDQALAKIGVEVVDTNKSNDALTLLLRVRQDIRLSSERWNRAAAALVKSSAKGKQSGQWDADVSKVLLERNGSVVYLWRVVLSGSVKKGQQRFGDCVLEALRHGVEVKTMPLVGQVKYPYDPASGKLKGGHDLNSATGVVAMHFTTV